MNIMLCLISLLGVTSAANCYGIGALAFSNYVYDYTQQYTSVR